MAKGTAIAVGGGIVAVGAGGYLLLRNRLGGVSKLFGSPCTSGSITSGLPATLNPTYQAQTKVGGPSPGPSGQHAFPCLWAAAPKSLPTTYQSGPKITRRSGQVYVVIATNMAVTGTMANGDNPANLGPWVGIAEYSNGTLVRVYPQRAAAFNGTLKTLGEWSGGF